jgi:hypothetical protein
MALPPVRSQVWTSHDAERRVGGALAAYLPDKFHIRDLGIGFSNLVITYKWPGAQTYICYNTAPTSAVFLRILKPCL